MYEIAGKHPSDTGGDCRSQAFGVADLDMEYAIGPNSFNFQEILGNLKTLSGLAREIGANC